MADENKQQGQQGEQGGAEQGGGGTSTAVKAAAAAAATGVAAMAARKALSGRGESSNGSSGSNGGSPSSRGSDLSSTLNTVLSGGWEAARDALIPAAEDAAGAAGEWVANNGPDIVRERIVPKFIESFNAAQDES